MDGKSSRNQEILPLADFKDRAIPLDGAPRAHSEPVATQSINQPIHPLADFQGMAQSVHEKVADATTPNERVGFLIDSDLARFFPTAESVNEALRALVTIARRNGKTSTS